MSFTILYLTDILQRKKSEKRAESFKSFFRSPGRSPQAKKVQFNILFIAFDYNVVSSYMTVCVCELSLVVTYNQVYWKIYFLTLVW